MSVKCRSCRYNTLRTSIELLRILWTPERESSAPQRDVGQTRVPITPSARIPSAPALWYVWLDRREPVSKNHAEGVVHRARARNRRVRTSARRPRSEQATSAATGSARHTGYEGGICVPQRGQTHGVLHPNVGMWAAPDQKHYPASVERPEPRGGQLRKSAGEKVLGREPRRSSRSGRRARRGVLVSGDYNAETHEPGTWVNTRQRGRGRAVEEDVPWANERCPVSMAS